MSTLPYYLATARDNRGNVYMLWHMGNYHYQVQEYIRTDGKDCDYLSLLDTSFEDAFEFLNGIGQVIATRWDM